MICDKLQTSTDAIVMLIQKKHSTYTNHTTDIMQPLKNLEMRYAAAKNADILLFHENEFQNISLNTTLNVRLCNVLNSKNTWGPPTNVIVRHKSEFSIGYRNMIRFYAVTMWNLLTKLKYMYVMRLDDDSVILSSIKYNLFESFRYKNAIYAYRQTFTECGTPNFNNFIRIQTNISYWKTFKCYGYYNNFFISKVAWWKTPRIAKLVKAFDDSGLIYKKDRSNDLIFQTAVVKIFAPNKIFQLYDWSYGHVTVNNNKWILGGASFFDLEDKINFISWMRDRYKIKIDKVNIKTCKIKNPLCYFEQKCKKPQEYIVGANKYGPTCLSNQAYVR